MSGPSPLDPDGESRRSRIRALDAAEAERRLGELAELLVDAVDSGASVNFLRGLSHAQAEAFWRGQLTGLGASRRLLVAEVDGRIAGTVIVTFAPQPNQPHRADVTKMMVHRSQRGRGLGAQLLAAAEDEARRHDKTLLCLDTETNSAGERLYTRGGWTKIGEIPGYALNTEGVPVPASFFYKQLD